MLEIPSPHRRATPQDARAMAELVNMAGEGLPLYLWTRQTRPGVSPWETGRERAMRDNGAFSYRNTILREQDGKVLACLIGYPLEHLSGPPDYSGLPPLVVPMQELEDEVPGTWYVNVLATYPEHRGRGYGRELLALAEAIAQDCGCHGMSIIVMDTNEGARRLYQRQGYLERARRPMVKEGWQHPGSELVLLVKDLV